MSLLLYNILCKSLNVRRLSGQQGFVVYSLERYLCRKSMLKDSLLILKGSLTSNLFSIDPQNQVFYEKTAEKGNLYEDFFCIDPRGDGKGEPEKEKVSIDRRGSVKSKS